MNFKVFIKGLVFLCSLAGAAYLLSLGMDESWIDENVRGQGLKGWLIFISLGGVLAAVGFRVKFWRSWGAMRLAS